MKNLKKVLALVLVVATLMGLATVAGATFTDADSIEYNEAVDVLSAINVIKGYTDGSFKPTDTVSRAEMAKMVTMIISGGEDVGDLYAAANTFSDCTTNWAKGYIAYANKTGIVAGVGGGKFNPTGDVTGTQAAKMMLCALGYDAAAEEYTGTNWSVNVLSDARDAGLLEGLEGVDMGAHMTREQTAQLMFNALKADMVKYDNGNINISNGDTNITIGGSKAEPVANTTAKDYRTTVSARDEVMQLCEKYFSDLKLTVATADVFGRPAQKWVYEKKDVGTYTTEADTTYTAEVKSKEIYADLGLTKTINATVTVDGTPVSNFSVAKNSSTALPASGNGVLTEVYYDVDAETVEICVVNTYVGEVTSVYEDADEPYSVIAGLSGNGGQFETTAYAEEDIVLYTYADGEIQSVALAEKVAGAEVTSVTSKSGVYTSVKADGTTYDMAAGLELDTDLSNTIAKDTSYDLYLDEYGYVIYVGYYEAGSSNYAYVLDAVVKQDDFNHPDDYYTVKLLKADGTIVTALSDIKSSAASPKSKWVTYTEDEDGYDLTVKASTSISNQTVAIETGKTAITVGGSSTYYGNNSTVYLVYNTTDDEYTAYTGMANVPDIDATGVYGSMVRNSTTGRVEYIYIKVAANEITSTSDDVIYIVAGSKSDLISDELGEYYEYNALVDGEITTLKVADGSAAASAITTTDKVIKGVTLNSKGLVTDLSSSVTGLTGPVIGTVKASGGTIGFGVGNAATYSTYAEDVNVYKIEDNELTVSSISAIKTDTNDSVLYVLDKGIVTDIFYTVKTGADVAAEMTSEVSSYIANFVPKAGSGLESVVMSGNTITLEASKDIEDSDIIDNAPAALKALMAKITGVNVTCNGATVSNNIGTVANDVKTDMQAKIPNAGDIAKDTVSTGSAKYVMTVTMDDNSTVIYNVVVNWSVAGTKA